MRRPADIVVVQADNRVDHLAGVSGHVAVRGLTMERQDEEYRPPAIRAGTRVVVVTDVLDPRCVRALRMSRRVGARTVLMMDGLADWRNIHRNPRVGDGFLSPAPVDVVCCSGMVDARTLSVLGNDARPTGLPRVDSVIGEPMPTMTGAPVLVATANTPAFDDDERRALVSALKELRDEAAWAGVELVWRLTGGLDAALGVVNAPGSLAEVLRCVGAVVTTPSTLVVESMRAGRPTAVLHPFETPIWTPSAWIWQPVDAAGSREPGCVEPVAGGLCRWVDSASRLLRQIRRPTREQLDRQAECLRLIDASCVEVEASELVAEVLVEQATCGLGPSAVVPIRPIARVPSRRPRRAGRRRVVSIVPFEHSPVGGVTTWSMRLSEAFEHRADLGYDLHTLLVSTRPPMALRAKPYLGDRVSLCVVDPTDDHFVTLSNVRRSVELHEPELVLPNYTDLAYAVATQLRSSGVPSVAIAHTDHSYYRDILKTYPDWDACVGVSGSIGRWLKPMAGDRPMETIVYGVPSSESPRVPGQNGPIRLAYVGRVAQAQKRVLDLVPMVARLAERGVEAELHIVGDGPELALLRHEIGSVGPVRVIFHGGQSPAWVERFWRAVDIAVLVSEYEGTSITMLEAMGCGVVPAVTRVDSGVGEWIEEGRTGITAPVGEPSVLADRIADLAQDRAGLRHIGHNAWELARGALGLETMAERYAEVFDRTLARPMEIRPTLAGVTLADRYRWTKQRTEDGTGELSWLRARLGEAGYRSIAVRLPGAGDDVVIVPAGDDGPDREQRQAWRGAGVEIVWSSLLPGGVEWAVLARHLRAMVAKGCRRIAVYGLGQHTQRRADVFDRQDFPVVGFIDDDPPPSGEALGLPVATVDSAIEVLNPDGVLISSDAWESEMWAKAKPLREAGV
ncbi:MAG TPA: glycosyltransferase, partial [Phycisphaerales bacterium]|nr:glycosyltransferase [Phycisphaerales bacterium]